MDRSDLAIRMKEYYEKIPRTKLIRRMPVAIRIDGKAFHTFTRGFEKPFDMILIKSMQDTMKYLCENIQGCVLGYTQSDEINLILVDYKKLNSDAWFDYEVQKMCSVAASMATMAFNRFFGRNVNEAYSYYIDNLPDECSKVIDDHVVILDPGEKIFDIYYDKIDEAMFDARVFNIPKEEVTNLIYWRQLDATRNSIQMVGQAHFSNNELDEKTCNMIQDMLMVQKGINWNKLPTELKRGSCCIKEKYYPELVSGDEECSIDATSVRTRWVIDKEIPIFKGEGRQYIDKLVFIGD